MSKRGISIIASVSVFINILLIGGIVGNIYSDFGHQRGGHPKGRMHHVLSELSEEKAEWYKQAIRESRQSRKESYKTIKVLRREAVEILEAEKFDVEGFKEKLQQLDELGATVKNDQINIMIDLAQKLNVSERRALSNFLVGHRKFRKQD